MEQESSLKRRIQMTSEQRHGAKDVNVDKTRYAVHQGPKRRGPGDRPFAGVYSTDWSYRELRLSYRELRKMPLGYLFLEV